MRSIRFQFAAFIAIVLATLLILLNIYPLVSSRDLVFEEKKNSLTGQVTVISSSLSSLDRLSRETVSEVISFLDTRAFQRTQVADLNGTVLYDDGGRTDVPSEFSEVAEALRGNTVFHSYFNKQAFESRCCVPVMIQGTICGAVCITEYDSDRAEIIMSVQSRIRIVSLVICGITMFFVALFAKVLLSRLQDLVQSMRIVANGNYGHRLEVRGSDEISELGTEFNQLTECLDKNERQRRRFVSDASHELKTPLASIRLLTDSIVETEGMDADTVREFVTDIGHEAERLQRTTEKLLDLSRMDDGVVVVPEPVDVKQTAVDAVSLLNPLATEKKVRIRCNLEDGCVVMATVDDMFHIAYNLIENAIKYNVEGGSVFVRLFAENESVKFIVEDTGIGIPEEDRLNIFARFYRVDKARSREAGGSGLGLSIVHDAVVLHGGTIAVGANIPSGSRFIVTFPLPSSEETGI